MKKINFKAPFKFLIIPFIVVIAVAVTISLIFGFRLGTEFSGGKRLLVNVTGQTKVAEIRGKTAGVLSANGLTVESINVSDSNGSSYLVFVTENNKNADFDEIRNKVAEKTELDISLVGEFESIASAVPANSVLLASIGFVLVLVAIFVAGVIRYKLAGGGMLAVGVVATILTHLSLLAITRVPIGIAVLTSVISSSILSLIIMIAILESVRSKLKVITAEQQPEGEMINDSANENLMPIACFCLFVLVFALFLIFTSLISTRSIGYSLIFGVISGGYVGFFLTTSLYPIFLEIANIRAKLKTTKNPNYKKKK